MKKFWDKVGRGLSGSLATYLYFLYMGSHVVIFITSFLLILWSIFNISVSGHLWKNMFFLFLIWAPLNFYSYKKIKNH